MSLHAKARTAAPTTRRAKSLGRNRIAFASLFALLACTGIGASSAAAAPPQLWQAGAGTGAGLTGTARGNAAAPIGAPNAGNVFVVDQVHKRISEFTAWGVFVKAWGWNVAATGDPGDTAPINEFEICTVACQAGSSGFGAGQFSAAGGVAVDAAGNVYAFEPSASRVQKFAPSGQFLRAWGGDVVIGGGAGTGNVASTSTQITGVLTTSKAFEVGQTITGAGIPAETRISAVGTGTITLSKAATATNAATPLTVATGADNNPLNETQTITVNDPKADAFNLTFSTPNPSNTEESTASISANASAAELEEALEDLDNIGAGNVEASGPAGGPWAVEFKGTRFVDTNVNQLRVDASVEVGKQLTCTGTPTGGAGATQVVYQWLAGGDPATGTGAATATYTVDATDAGKALQCRVRATHTAGAAPTGSTQVSNPTSATDRSGVIPASPASGLPPAAPTGSIAAPGVEGGGNLIAAGKVLTCAAGAWTGTTLPFEYQWYRNGVAIAAATNASFEVQAAEVPVGTAANYQCAVTGSNAHGSVTKVSASRITAAPLTAPAPAAPSAGAAVPALSGAIVATTQEGAAAPEICAVATECKGGVQGSANGMFGAVQGLSTLIDASGFNIYVGDEDRVQRFNADGAHQANISLGTEDAQHLAVDAAGNLYLAYRSSGNTSKPNVFKLNPSGTTTCTYEVASNPRGLDVAPDGQVFAFNATNSRIMRFASSCTLEPPTAPAETFPEPTTDLSNGSTGLAVNNCGTSENSVYHSNNSPSFLRAYSEAPDPDLCGAPPERPPVITEAHVLAAATDGATVRARVNPRFWEDTAYRVEYATVACIDEEGWEGGCVEESQGPPGTQLGAGVVNAATLTKGVHLLGLQPDTAYRYRFVAVSSGGDPVYGEAANPGSPAWEDCVLNPLCGQARALRTLPVVTTVTDCPNQAFRVGPSAGLPDCRAYEMVSPLDKNNGDVNRGLGTFDGQAKAVFSKAAADGKGLTYSSYRAFGALQSAPFASQYLSWRDPAAGWSVTDSISAPVGVSYLVDKIPAFDTQFRIFSEDLCSGWIFHEFTPALTPGALAGYPNLYRRDNCGAGRGAFHPVTAGASTPEFQAREFLLDLQGASENGDHTIFRVWDKLTADAPSNRHQLYERHPGGLRAVCVPPDGTNAVNENCSAGSANVTQGGRPDTESNRCCTRYQSVENAISDDGMRIFWSAGTPGPLYVRIGGVKTLQLATANGRFQTAATDGSAAVISVGGQLNYFDVDKAVALDKDGKDGTEIIAGATTPIAAGLVGTVLGAGEDVENVYFVSTQALTGSQVNSEGAVAQSSQNNVYHWAANDPEDPGDDAIKFIATLVSGDVQVIGTTEGFSPAHRMPIRHTARASADGLRLSFSSLAQLTGSDNINRENGQPLEQVFAYDAAAGKLACVSCHSGGVRPVGREYYSSDIRAIGHRWYAANLPVYEVQTYARRSLNEDGSRIFFESFNSLVPADTNGQKDVYQFVWADDAQQCASGGSVPLRSNAGDMWGCVALISTGKSPQDSEFMDADRKGESVFIATESSLVPEDYGLRDAYVARIGGGSAPAQKPAECEGEACQGPASPPGFENPSSSSFEGPGNSSAATPARCNGNQVRRGNRCVAKRKLAKRACAKRRGQAKQRCVAKQMRRLSTTGRAGR